MALGVLLGSDRITADPCDMLLHYALGDTPGYTAEEPSPVAWLRETHRGIHTLGEISIPRGQRRYVLGDKFEFRINTAFKEVLEGCAALSRTGSTWIVPGLFEAYLKLHQWGFAHSYETWCEGQLAGGCFGVQLGGYVSVESMFYRVSHASKAAYARALHHFKDRGIHLVDSNPVNDPSRNYGEQWVPQWKFESMLRQAMSQPVPLVVGKAPPQLPWRVKRALPIARFFRRLTDRLRGGPSLSARAPVESSSDRA